MSDIDHDDVGGDDADDNDVDNNDAEHNDVDDNGVDDNGVDDNGVDDNDADDNDVTTAKAVLEYVVSALVEEKDSVRVDVDDSHRTLQLEVRVGPDDMGRVIGRRGRVANAIRTLTRAAAARDGIEVDVEFVD